MRARHRRWWPLVLRRLCERSVGTPREPGPITDEEMAPLARDSWGLYDDLARHSLLLCPPVLAREDWRQWSPERVPPPPTWNPSRREGHSPTGYAGGDIHSPTRRL
jgi:hypothetical protein